MKRAERDEWVAELRSGRRAQGFGALLDNEERECCLGVKCSLDVEAERYRLMRGYYPHSEEYFYFIKHQPHKMIGMPDEDLLTAWGLPEGQAYHLASLNDSEGKTFKEIADWIENNVLVEE